MEMHHEQANPKNAVVSDVLLLQTFFDVIMKQKYSLNCKLLLLKLKMHNEIIITVILFYIYFTYLFRAH